MVMLSKKDSLEIKKKLIGRIAQRLIKKNKNFLAVFIGETGSGKSLSSITLAHMIESEVKRIQLESGIPEEDIKIDPDTLHERIVFTAKDFMELTDVEEVEKENGQKDYTLKHLNKGNVVIWDESGAGDIDNQKWQSNVAVAINHVVQTFRSDNIGVIFTVPYRDWINKKIRQLLHATFETQSIIKSKRRVLLKFFYVRKDHKTGGVVDVYPRVVLRGRKIKIGRVMIPKPPVKIINRYNKKKEEFNFITKQKARDSIEKMNTKEEEIPRMTDAQIEQTINELAKNVRIIGSFRNGNWTVSKSTITGLYKCHQKDANTIQAMLLLKLNK